MPEAESQDISRARRAYEAVEALRSGDDPKGQEKNKQRLQEVPFLLRTHGLGQTIAFLMAKDKDDDYKRAWQVLVSGTFGVIPERPLPPDKCSDKRAVAEWLGSEKHTTTIDRRLLREALAYSTWLKRWAEALLRDDE
jgi:CRISPR type III-B/RAMP module-associated protein Cmr5